MPSSHRFLLHTLAVLLLPVSVVSAQYARPKATEGVGIDQKLNAPVPLDLTFHDEYNQLVPLRTYFGDKPVVIEMVYFNCTSLCPMSISESVMGLNRISLQAGRDYNVIVVSFDPKDTPQEALAKKQEYAKTFRQKGFNEGWHFLTGSQDSIARLASAIGWRYRWDEPSNQFIHAGGIMIATPEGRLSRYIYGIQYAPQDLRMSLVDASQHRIGSPMDYVLLFCFHYNAAVGKYTLAIFNIVKLSACITVLGLAAMIFLFLRGDKNKGAGNRWPEVRHVR